MIRLVKRRTAMILVALFVGALGFFSSQSPADAATVGWDASKIISDSIFTDYNSMNAEQIQSFLYIKGVYCTVGNCFKNYSENNKSSAQIIYEAAQEFRISPKVLIVLLQKEQGLITINNPASWRYNTATGYGCPDTATCNAQYYGLTNQIRWSARMFRAIMDASPTWYTPYVLGNNYIQYNPNQACGGSAVYIQNRATQALYNYTPYQPNQATIDAAMGVEVPCGAYGNINFYRYFTSWFGNTYVPDAYPWSVIRTSDDGRLFLVVGNTKRWIPTGEIYTDWNLSVKPVQVVSQSYFDNIPTIPELGRFGVVNGTAYYIDGGYRWWLSSNSAIANWGLEGQVAAPLYSLISDLPFGGELKSLVRDDSTTYLLDDGILFPIASNDVQKWAGVGSTIPSLTTNGLSKYVKSSQIGYKIIIEGKKYLASNGRLLMLDANTEMAYGSIASGGFITVGSTIKPILTIEKASRLVRATDSPHWQLVIEGYQYHVPSTTILPSWSISQSEQPQLIDSSILANLPGAGDLQTLVHSTSTNTYYFVDGQKHLIQQSLASDWIGNRTAVEVTSETTIGIPSGTAIDSTLFKLSGAPHIYITLNGKFYHIPNGEVLNGVGYPSKHILTLDTVGNTLIQSQLSQLIAVAGTTYYLQDGSAYPINPAYLASWNTTNPTLLSTLPNSLTQMPTAIGLVTTNGHRTFLLNNGTLVDITAYADAYGTLDSTSLDIKNLPEAGIAASYLVRSSSTRTDSRIWLISNGKKQWISSGFLFSAFGGRSAPTSWLDDTTLSSIPTNDQIPSMFIQSGTSGIKFLTENGYLSFPDGATLSSVVGTSQVQQMPLSIFNTLSINSGNVSRLLKDNRDQRIYLMEAGKKRWITNSRAYQTYAAIPLTVLSSEIVSSLPTGQPIE